jgi:hypothetical protein
MDLYRVFTVVAKYHGCRNVNFAWFRTEPAGDRPYELLIDGYFPGDPYTEGAIDELFTHAEAAAIKAYLDKQHGHEGVTSIERAEVPIAGNVMPLGAIAVGGGDDFYMLDKEDEYSLPFRAWAYFNLTDCELVDEPGETFRHYLHVMSVDEDGGLDIHKETQLEARAREDTPTPEMLKHYMQTGRYRSPEKKGGA